MCAGGTILISAAPHKEKSVDRTELDPTVYSSPLDSLDMILLPPLSGGKVGVPPPVIPALVASVNAVAAETSGGAHRGRTLRCGVPREPARR